MPGHEPALRRLNGDSIRHLLVEAQNRDGGWGARQGAPSGTEATSLALLALEPHHANEQIQAGRVWLRGRQRPDGAWPPLDQVPLASWMTPLAVLALSRSAPDRARALRGAEWILSREGRGYSWLTKLFYRLFPERDVIELDPDLTGWPWTADTFSWVEPTAYALIALKTLRRDLPPERARARIGEGEQMILDRTCTGGGWNYGNSRVLDEELWPYPDTTALVLIALQDLPLRPQMRKSLDALEKMMARHDSGLAVALAILALQLYGRDVSALRGRLAAAQDALASMGETRAIALAALAIDESRTPFRFDGDDRP